MNSNVLYQILINPYLIRILNCLRAFIFYDIQKMQISIKKFFTVCTHLAFESARIIHSIHQSSSLQTYLKGQNDPVTEADYKAQSLIIKGLRSHWPQIRIVGEQDKQYQGEIIYDYQKLKNPIFKQDSFALGKNKQELSDHIDIDKMTVWIDPLDGTLSYTQGYLDEVTTLIGASYQGKARFGIIGSPYKKIISNNNIRYQFDPRVFVGDSLKQNAYQIDSNLNVKIINPRTHNKQKRLCLSRSHMNPEALKRMESISKNISRMGGIGKKALEIVEDKADSFVYLGRGIGSWDICAPQALIQSVNGHLTKANGDRNNYDVIGKHAVEGGAVLCIDNQLQEEVIKKIRQFK